MSRDELLVNKKRQRVSTKYRKNHRVNYRYGDKHQQIINKCRIDHDFDVGTKTPILLDKILDEWFEMKTIQEFQREDPDLMIQMKKQEDKQLWIDFIYDHCDTTEIRALMSACGSVLEYGKRVVSKIKNK